MNKLSDTPLVYTGQAANIPMVIGTSVGTVALLVTAASSGGDWSVGLIALGIGCLGILAEIATASSVRATAGPAGVRVYWGLAGWPRLRYDIADIKSAQVVTVPWWAVSYGFWWTPTRTVCTVRGGDALRLQLTSGRKVTISVPQPAAAVAAITAAARP